MKDYKKKCDGCGKFYLVSKMIYVRYGRHRCVECASSRVVKGNYRLQIPAGVCMEAGICEGDKVVCVASGGGILIKKNSTLLPS